MMFCCVSVASHEFRVPFSALGFFWTPSRHVFLCFVRVLDRKYCQSPSRNYDASVSTNSACGATIGGGSGRLQKRSPTRKHKESWPTGEQLAMLPCQHFYTVVLSRGHVITVNGVACITLGHGFQHPKLRHPRFGTERVIKDLQQDPG